MWILPLMVLNMLGQTANGLFFISWSIAVNIFAIAGATAQSLFSEGSNREEFLERDIRRSLKFTTILLAPAVVLVTLFADKLLLVFGDEYYAQGANLLKVMAFSATPNSSAGASMKGPVVFRCLPALIIAGKVSRETRRLPDSQAIPGASSPKAGIRR